MLACAAAADHEVRNIHPHIEERSFQGLREARESGGARDKTRSQRLKKREKLIFLSFCSLDFASLAWKFYTNKWGRTDRAL